MFEYTKGKYMIVSMILIAILFTSTIVNAAVRPSYSSKQIAGIFNDINMLINLQKTPDEIARSRQAEVIHSIEQSVIKNKIK